ncbi:MAG TPA: YceI family protein [Azospira sp.]|nr:YceI family protein [Azospira sp.]
MIKQPLSAATAAATIAAFLALPAQAVEYGTVQAAASSVGFTYKQMNVPVDGKFKKVDTRIAFDPAKPQAASTTLEIDLASIDAGSQEANDEVAGKLWFNTKAFPKASFVSSSVKALGNNRYEVSGKLSLKGKTLDASAPFTFKQDGANGVFDGAFVLKRADYGIGEGMWADFGTVANEIQIKFHVVAAPIAAAKK